MGPYGYDNVKLEPTYWLLFVVRFLLDEYYTFLLLVIICMADGVGEVNWEGVKYYNALIDGLLKRGMFNFAYLLHHIMFDCSIRQFDLLN